MLATQKVIDGLADRIERAYRLRRPRWQGIGSAAGVWAAAASRLLEVGAADPSVPPDPELFVAAQPVVSSCPDPWGELTEPAALRRYRRRVRSIVRGLRSELTREVRHAEGRIRAGEEIGEVLQAKDPRLSALGRFVVARRAGRAVLAADFREQAASQHWSCPLYRQAAAGLLPFDEYPVSGSSGPSKTTAAVRRARNQVSLN